MIDDNFQILKHRYQHSPDLATGVEIVKILRRIDQISPTDIKVAAHLGHPVAHLFNRDAEFIDISDWGRRNLLFRQLMDSQEHLSLISIGIKFVEETLPAYQQVFRDNHRLRTAQVLQDLKTWLSADEAFRASGASQVKLVSHNDLVHRQLIGKVLPIESAQPKAFCALTILGLVVSMTTQTSLAWDYFSEVVFYLTEFRTAALLNVSFTAKRGRERQEYALIGLEIAELLLKLKS